jgi:hypothetical protein
VLFAQGKLLFGGALVCKKKKKKKNVYIFKSFWAFCEQIWEFLVHFMF